MGSIREIPQKDGTTKYHVEIRRKGHKTERKTLRTKTEAKRWMASIESSMSDGRHSNQSEACKRTVGEAIDRFITLWLPHYPDREQKQAALLSRWKLECGFLHLSQLTPSVIIEVRDKLLSETTKRGTKRSPATVNRYLSALGKLLTVAVIEWGWLHESPMRKVTKCKEPNGRERYLTELEIGRLLEECKKSKNRNLYSLVKISLITGARYSELANLTWENVFFENSLLIFRKTKNGEDRKIPMTCKVKYILQSLYENQQGKKLVFQSKRDGNSTQPLNVRTAFQRALERAEIHNFTWHDLRHTAASYMAMGGASIGELMAILRV